MLDNVVIGRGREHHELLSAYNSKEAELIAVYGRRRIGKTYLIKSFCTERKTTFMEMVGTNDGTLEEHLTAFAKELSKTFYQSAPLQIPKNWSEAFEALQAAISQQPKNKKIVLFFDEMPWLATPRSGIVKAFEYYWNRFWSFDNRIKFIICGSSAAWIIKKIIKNKGGLHNRVTRKIKLQPLTLEETKSFLLSRGIKLDHIALTKLYMIMGGIPFYLKGYDKKLSMDQNINRLFLDSKGMFFDEFEEVFSSLFRHPEGYKELIMLIAKSQSGLSRKEIIAKSKNSESGGRLSERLEDLENAGFIQSYTPFQQKKQNVFYRITDQYCYFYLKWVVPIKQQLKLESRVNYWQRYTQSPGYKSWQGYAFENVCYQHLLEIKRAMKIDDTALASPWRYTPKKGSLEEGAQIDLLFDRIDGCISIVEIKFSEKPFKIDKDYAKKLLRKIEVFEKQTGTKCKIFLTVVSASGLKEGIYSEDLVDTVVTVDDLFIKV